MMSSAKNDALVGSKSSAEKRFILENLLLSSPPGEIIQVYNDLKAIVRNDKNLVKHMEKVFKKYNCENLIVATNPVIKTPFILSNYSLLPEDKVYDPRSKKMFKFDHFSNKASGFTDYVHCRKLESLREEFEKIFDNYVNIKYPKGVLAVHSVDNSIQILISSSIITPKKYINGRWCSSWVYNPSDYSISGNLSVNVHYFESGNVQLKVTDSVSKTIPFHVRSSDNIANTVLKIITEYEDNFHVTSKLKFEFTNDKIFKNLRKILPVTKTTMNWDAIASYNVIDILNTL